MRPNTLQVDVMLPHQAAWHWSAFHIFSIHPNRRSPFQLESLGLQAALGLHIRGPLNQQWLLLDRLFSPILDQVDGDESSGHSSRRVCFQFDHNDRFDAVPRCTQQGQGGNNAFQALAKLVLLFGSTLCIPRYLACLFEYSEIFLES